MSQQLRGELYYKRKRQKRDEWLLRFRIGQDQVVTLSIADKSLISGLKVGETYTIEVNYTLWVPV